MRSGNAAKIVLFSFLIIACAAILGQLIIDGRSEENPYLVPTTKVEIPALRWPIVGPISSDYNAGHPLGIDIDDSWSAPHQLVVSATDGKVAFAGGKRYRYYGLYIIIVSPFSGGEIVTLYAHLDSIDVVKDQVIKKGEVIGQSGCSGGCSGPHLHFELFINGVRENPLHFLP